MTTRETATFSKTPGPPAPIPLSPERALPCRQRLLLVLLVVLGLLMASCKSAPASTPASAQAPSSGSPLGPTSSSQVETPAFVAQPSPSAAPTGPGTGQRSASEPATRTDTAPKAVTASESVATSLAPGWTQYDSINQVFDLAFAADSTLWAATGGGLVHWEPDSKSYTRYAIQPSKLALAPDGALWLVIDGNLWHFDGSTARFYTAPGPLDGPIRSMAVEPDGTLWLATRQGIERFDGRDWREYPLSGAEMLVLGHGGELWAAKHQGVGRYLPEEDRWVTYNQDGGPPDGNSQALAVTPSGQVWVYYPWQGLYILDEGSGELVWSRIEDPCGTRLSDLVATAEGTIWVSSAGSGHYPGACVAYHDGEQWVEVAGGTNLLSTAQLAPGPAGELAASTSQGIGLYTGGAWRLLRDGPTRDAVTTVAVTPDGSAWFGFGDSSVSTPGTGISQFDGEAWHYHLDGAEVNVLAAAPDGSLWAGVGCSVRRYDGHAWQTLAGCGEQLPAGNILDIAFTPDGTAWVANGFSLASYDGLSWTVHDRLANALIAAPEGAPGREALWVSGWEGTQGSQYVARLDGDNWEQHPVAESFPGNFLPGAVTPEGQLCGLHPGQGLACFDGGDWSSAGAWSFYGEVQGLGLPVAAPDGALWASTPVGLARWEAPATGEGAWTLYSLGAGELPHRPGPMAIGPAGEVWVGAARFQP